jgi:hypothetical protein
MGTVLSFADARAASVKAKLNAYAQSRRPAAIAAADVRVEAQRIFCREAMAVLIDRYGYQTRLDYRDIRDVRPIVPTPDIFQFAKAGDPSPADARPGQVVPFPMGRSWKQWSGKAARQDG